jgi:Mce-associated membrane protein
VIRLTLTRGRTGTEAAAPEAATDETAASAKHDTVADEQQVQPDAGTDATDAGESAESAAPDSGDTDDGKPAETATKRKGFSWRAALVYGLLPALAMLLTLGAGFLKWKDSTAHEADTARVESVQAATDGTIKMLSYQPDSAANDLGSARDRMTGSFRDSYTELIHDVVIPGAQQKRISAVATVPAAASVSAGPSHAVVLVFVNQTIIVGNDAPSSTASSVRVALDKVGNSWLISDFTPV